jgi:hypothetical protein
MAYAKECIMRLSHVIGVAVVAFAFAGGAAATGDASQTVPVQAAPPTVQVTAPAAAQSVPANADKLICHQVVYDGMLVRRPQCHSAHEWEARQATRQRELEQLQIRASSHGG